MDRIFHRIDAWEMALAFALAMLVCWAFGYRLGRHLKPEPGEDPAIKFTDASMALLGLLLAFTFSITLNRHDQRRLAVVAESNAIGDFYTCVSLLKDPRRSTLQLVIRDYARLQLDKLREFSPEAEEEKGSSPKRVGNFSSFFRFPGACT